jgi:hypothetical protein
MNNNGVSNRSELALVLLKVGSSVDIQRSDGSILKSCYFVLIFCKNFSELYHCLLVLYRFIGGHPTEQQTTSVNMDVLTPILQK